jgi:hypothetical protein
LKIYFWNQYFHHDCHLDFGVLFRELFLFHDSLDMIFYYLLIDLNYQNHLFFYINHIDYLLVELFGLFHFTIKNYILSKMFLQHLLLFAPFLDLCNFIAIKL